MVHCFVAGRRRIAEVLLLECCALGLFTLFVWTSKWNA
jgi:hypothetical protein